MLCNVLLILFANFDCKEYMLVLFTGVIGTRNSTIIFVAAVVTKSIQNCSKQLI
jgi:hypothetical protein